MDGERSLVNALCSGKKTAAARPAEDAATKNLGGTGRGGVNKRGGLSADGQGRAVAYKLRKEGADDDKDDDQVVDRRNARERRANGANLDISCCSCGY